MKKRRRYHIDKRAGDVIAASDGGADDLLDTEAVAKWLGVSTQFLEIGRSRGYGPEFTRIAARVVRYKRGDILAWLETRKHACTKEYA